MSIQVRRRIGRSWLLAIAFIVVTSSVVANLKGLVYADYERVINRSLTVDSTVPGAVTDYTFRWSFPSVSSVRSVKFLLCYDTYVESPCSSTPTGDFSTASLSSQSGAVTGFSILSQDTDEIIMSRASAPAPVGQSEYVFSNMQNPTGFPGAFYVQIFTYPTADATGVANFMSSVANATAEPILITTEVPPILFFCAAVTVDMWCQNTGSQIIDLGNLSTVVENAGTSQFGVATNADNGYTVTINGTTLTSGNKVIDVMSVPAANAPGTAQFGLNIRANTNPALGQDITGLGIGTVTANYDTPDQFLYQNGDIVATAVTGTLFDIFTVTYIVNVPPDQPSGVYNTTIAYICTASF